MKTRIYTRVSREVKETRSLRKQAEKVKAYAKRHGMKILETHREKQR